MKLKKLKDDAEKFADEDKKKKESIELKNEAQSYIYTTEKLINQDLKDKISQEQGIKISDAIKEVKEVLDSDVEKLKTKLDSLKSIVNEITTELYKNVTPPPGGAQEGSGQNQQESTTDSQDTGSSGKTEQNTSNSQNTSENKQ